MLVWHCLVTCLQHLSDTTAPCLSPDFPRQQPVWYFCLEYSFSLDDIESGKNISLVLDMYCNLFQLLLGTTVFTAKFPYGLLWWYLLCYSITRFGGIFCIASHPLLCFLYHGNKLTKYVEIKIFTSKSWYWSSDSDFFATTSVLNPSLAIFPVCNAKLRRTLQIWFSTLCFWYSKVLYKYNKIPLTETFRIQRKDDKLSGIST